MIATSVVGIGAWAPGLASWPAWRDARVDDAPTSRPSASLLPAAERRRAPDGVSVALAVAQEAVAMAGDAVDVASLPTVFASACGDLAIVDYLCATLASDPLAVSPTRFHHSVHNAAAGYWSIATGDVAAATAIAAGATTFANGLLEAAVQATTRDGPVLFVVFDTPAVGPLARAAPNTALFGCALVLAPAGASTDATTSARLALAIEPRACEPPVPRRAALRPLAASSPAAGAIALLDALADARRDTLACPLGPATTLAIRVG